MQELLSALLSILACWIPLLSPDSIREEPRELFLTHCASCHGEKGDGKGTTVLPRPARSFLDGGFSYGNTRTAIGRTVAHGIPGTPMPGFSAALSDVQRDALVEFVIALGPERKEVTPGETVLQVGEDPLVVRGYLPAVAEGAPEFPRGLLVGLPTGTTFQYRADDVRLIAVRQGEFVERRDWGGRGGNPLKPLGKTTFVTDGGRPRSTFHARRLDGGSAPLVAKLSRTAIHADGVSLHYVLRAPDGTTAGTMEEVPRAVQCSVGAGFARAFVWELAGPAVHLEARGLLPPEVGEVAWPSEGSARFTLDGQPYGALWDTTEIVYVALVRDDEATMRTFVQEMR